ncbi:hypothetical protein SAMN05444161_5119 [Rhizobiales bacterium GAS191]|nr:hypothetical protein SAMN05519103_04390 [Rhizobiales bacterium GAS113]SEE20481.1 hypothetical protein SAMN05444161_5119 [Rhizobiales bacterium GAS191]
MRARLSVILLFSATMGLAGFLLFQVQPMLAKFILPWFGGSATTWTVCMLFFQCALLLGYAYAYAVTQPLTLRTQAILQIGILVAAVLLFLPITPSDALKPVDSKAPVWRIISLLGSYVGMPYIVLSTTSPLLQRWLGHLDKKLLASRFFAISNFGSFLGLLSYPFVFEPFMTTLDQTKLWSYAFDAYALLFAGCAIVVAMSPSGAKLELSDDAGASQARHKRSFPLWLLYSALGSVLLLATTNQIAQWSAVVPFLWVLPLSIYLLTFVFAFGHQRAYRRTPYLVAFVALAVLSQYLARPESSEDLLLQLGLQCATLFAGCMICHGEMVRLQPPTRDLPRFYMAVALGGALGGAVVTLLAPLIFRDFYEHSLAIAAIAGLAFRLDRRRLEPKAPPLPRYALLAALAVFIAGVGRAVYGEMSNEGSIVERVRNFYGVVKVYKTDEDDPQEYSFAMQQAGVDQGSQYQAAAKRRLPACAYDEQSGIGLALRFQKKRRGADPNAPLRVGIIGLGAGMAAAHGRPGDVLRYYELNPAVTKLAIRHFSFLQDGLARVEIAEGDGRILLERESQGGASQKFDVLIIDAFRGASPPMHLMTREAFDVYLRHLQQDGILAINFELDTFEMAPLHRGLAGAFGMKVNWFETDEERPGCDEVSSWALYSRDAGLWAVPEVKEAISDWRDESTSKLVWTDNSANLMSIITW